MISAVFVIIGTIIGAGFASGKEIFTFFNIYGVWGLWGLLISEFIMGIIIYKTFCIIIKKNVSSYSEFVGKVMTSSRFSNSVICNIVNIFLLISFVVMVAGFSAYFSQEYNLSYFFGATIISVLSFFTFLKNVDGIIKINKYFIPILIFIILWIGIKNLHCFSSTTYYTSAYSSNWLLSSLLYASYNSIIVIPILITLKGYVSTLKKAKIASFITIVFLLLMSLILFFLLNFYFPEIQNLELPIIYISTKLGVSFKYICGFIILGAIFTTAISSGYGFLTNLNKKQYIYAALTMCLVSIPLSNIGFSNLLNLLYPILGFLRLYTNYICFVFF